MLLVFYQMSWNGPPPLGGIDYRILRLFLTCFRYKKLIFHTSTQCAQARRIAQNGFFLIFYFYLFYLKENYHTLREPKNYAKIFHTFWNITFFIKCTKTQEKYEVMFFGPISKTIDQIKKTYRDDPNCFEVLGLVMRPFLKKCIFFSIFK